MVALGNQRKRGCLLSWASWGWREDKTAGDKMWVGLKIQWIKKIRAEGQQEKHVLLGVSRLFRVGVSMLLSPVFEWEFTPFNLNIKEMVTYKTGELGYNQLSGWHLGRSLRAINDIQESKQQVPGLSPDLVDVPQWRAFFTYRDSLPPHLCGHELLSSGASDGRT